MEIENKIIDGKYVCIMGSIELHRGQHYDAGIVDDGTLAQKICDIMSGQLIEYGVHEISVDFEHSVGFKENN
jgi:hypothetical protein